MDPLFKQHAFTSQATYANIKEAITKIVTADYDKDKRTREVEKEGVEDNPPAQKKKFNTNYQFGNCLIVK